MDTLITPQRQAEFRAEYAKGPRKGYVVRDERGYCRCCFGWFPGNDRLVLSLRGKPVQMCVRCNGVW